MMPTSPWIILTRTLIQVDYHVVAAKWGISYMAAYLRFRRLKEIMTQTIQEELGNEQYQHESQDGLDGIPKAALKKEPKKELKDLPQGKFDEDYEA